MKKWIRNLLIGMMLNSAKNSKIGQATLAKLKKHNILIGRVGIGLFTALGAVKYYYPELPVDDSVEILGIVFSWLALELGFETVKQEELAKFDPNKPIDIDLGDFKVSLPSLSEIDRKIRTDDTGEAEEVETDGKKKE